MHELIQALQTPTPDRTPVEVGDTVRVYIRIIEGDRERTQPFQGVVIRARKGNNNANFTVRRIATH
jgi:large subunit ribosomal protein L19